MSSSPAPCATVTPVRNPDCRCRNAVTVIMTTAIISVLCSSPTWLGTPRCMNSTKRIRETAKIMYKHNIVFFAHPPPPPPGARTHTHTHTHTDMRARAHTHTEGINGEWERMGQKEKDSILTHLLWYYFFRGELKKIWFQDFWMKRLRMRKKAEIW